MRSSNQWYCWTAGINSMKAWPNEGLVTQIQWKYLFVQWNRFSMIQTVPGGALQRGKTVKYHEGRLGTYIGGYKCLTSSLKPLDIKGKRCMALGVKANWVQGHRRIWMQTEHKNDRAFLFLNVLYQSRISPKSSVKLDMYRGWLLQLSS